MTIHVREITQQDAHAYRSYWNDAPGAHFFQRLEWDDVFGAVYGYRPRHLIAESGKGRVCGIMPLYEVKSLLFGRSLKSMPFHTEGGMCGGDQTVEVALFQGGLDVARRLGISRFDLKHREGAFWEERTPEGWGHAAIRYDRFALELHGRTPEELFASFKQDVRNAVRKAAKSGLHVTVSRDRRDLDHFYKLMLLFSAESGLPCHPFPFFKALFDTFIVKGEGGISLAWYEGRPIAGKMFFMDTVKGVVFQNWSAALGEYRKLKANSLILWEEIKFCQAEGMQSFDFGVTNSQHTNSAFFKSRWDTRSTPVYFHQFAQGKELASRDDHSDFQLAKRAWRYLPTWAIDLIGRGLMKHLA